MARRPAAKKSFGQHWLEDAAALSAMVAAGAVKRGETVLEVGPGYGTLTARLLERGAKVTALEYDQSLLPRLLERFAEATGGTLDVQHGDIRRYDFSQLPKDYKIVANIPYYLTSNLVQRLSQADNPPSVAVLLVQKEVAERITASPGNLSVLGVTAQFYWRAHLGRVVAADLFTPPPKVDSQILVLERRPKPLFKDVDAADFIRVVKAGFSQKRKTLENSLSGGLAISKTDAAGLLKTVGVAPGRRAQSLSLDEWHTLAQAAAALAQS